MSAKWRRSKKSSRWNNILKKINRNKTKGNTPKFRIDKPRIKRRTRHHEYRFPKTLGKLREPEPLIDVLEDRHEIIVVTEFVGFKRENLKINVKSQHLTLSAETPDRRFHKSLNLPKRVIPRTMHTKYKNGVLEIRLKKAVMEKTIDEVAG